MTTTPQRQLGSDGPAGGRARARLHEHVRGLRAGRRRRRRGDPQPGHRPRRHPVRHGRHLRRHHQRGARRAHPRAPPRRGGAGHEVRDQVLDDPGREAAPRRRRIPRVRAQRVRRLPRPPGRRPRRPLLPAPTRRRRAHRGDRRGDGRARRGRQGPPPRPLRGVGRDHPPCRRRAPDRRPPERVVDLEPRHRGRGGARLPRARHHRRALQPARARLPHGHRPGVVARRPPRGRLPPHPAPLPGRCPGGQPGDRRRGAGHRRGAWRHTGPGGARLAARPGRRRRAHPRARSGCPGWRRTSAPSTWRSSPATSTASGSSASSATGPSPWRGSRPRALRAVGLLSPRRRSRGPGR